MSVSPSSSDPSSTVLSKELEVRNKSGIHARPAALLVKTACRYTCEIMIEHNGLKVSAKSIMGLLTIEGHHGALLRVEASGPDAEEALEAIAELFTQKFHED